jgi:hypothetical protein
MIAVGARILFQAGVGLPGKGIVAIFLVRCI